MMTCFHLSAFPSVQLSSRIAASCHFLVSANPASILFSSLLCYSYISVSPFSLSWVAGVSGHHTSVSFFLIHPAFLPLSIMCKPTPNLPRGPWMALSNRAIKSLYLLLPAHPGRLELGMCRNPSNPAVIFFSFLKFIRSLSLFPLFFRLRFLAPSLIPFLHSPAAPACLVSATSLESSLCCETKIERNTECTTIMPPRRTRS